MPVGHLLGTCRQENGSVIWLFWSGTPASLPHSQVSTCLSRGPQDQNDEDTLSLSISRPFINHTTHLYTKSHRHSSEYALKPTLAKTHSFPKGERNKISEYERTEYVFRPMKFRGIFRLGSRVVLFSHCSSLNFLSLETLAPILQPPTLFGFSSPLAVNSPRRRFGFRRLAFLGVVSDIRKEGGEGERERVRFSLCGNFETALVTGLCFGQHSGVSACRRGAITVSEVLLQKSFVVWNCEGNFWTLS